MFPFDEEHALVAEWLLLYKADGSPFYQQEIDSCAGIEQVSLVCKELLEAKCLEKKQGKLRLAQASSLLATWMKEYHVLKNNKIYTFDLTKYDRAKCLELLSSFKDAIVLALHSASANLGYKYTNLETLEFYLLRPELLRDIQSQLCLEPKEGSLQGVIIEPYYKKIIQKSEVYNHLKTTSSLMTVIDLYQYPLIGTDQAEFIARKNPHLKKLNFHARPLW